MLIYLDIRNMTFEEENNLVNHQIVIRAGRETFEGYDETTEIKEEKLKKSDDKYFITREQDTWFSFPIYELKNNKMIDFDYTKYKYFLNAERRERVVSKINDLYHPSSEAKIIRKTLKYIMDNLNIPYPDFFKKYNDKIEKIISKNPK